MLLWIIVGRKVKPAGQCNMNIVFEQSIKLTAVSRCLKFALQAYPSALEAASDDISQRA